MQLQFQREGLPQEKPAQRGLAHFRGVFELHVIAHRCRDGLHLPAREPKALQNGYGHLRADLFVFVEMNDACERIAGGGQRLGDIMEQDGPGQQRIGLGRQMPQHEQKVVEDAAFRVVIGGLFAMHRGGQFR